MSMSTGAAKAVVRLNTGEVQGRDNFEVFEEMESMESHLIVANQDSSSTLYERVGTIRLRRGPDDYALGCS